MYWPKTSSTNFDISITQRRNYIALAYQDHHAWLKYLPLYHDLFTSLDEAKTKAKTHSVMVTCNYLILTRGCTPQMVYESFTAEFNVRNFRLSHSLLHFETQLSFMICLCKIR